VELGDCGCALEGVEGLGAGVVAEGSDGGPLGDELDGLCATAQLTETSRIKANNESLRIWELPPKRVDRGAPQVD